MLFASVQARSGSICARFAPDAFDYVVIDEVHHAHAESYGESSSALPARWLLGLTAATTPERADEGDVFGLFDEHVTFRADIRVGIDRGAGAIPLLPGWPIRPTSGRGGRGGGSPPEAIAGAVQTEGLRMAQPWAAWQAHPGTRTLVFCCTIEHAQFDGGGSGRGACARCACALRAGSHDRCGGGGIGPGGSMPS
ncbi:MAG: DEAD/DEAH box helicase family protein [bacterium]